MFKYLRRLLEGPVKFAPAVSIPKVIPEPISLNKAFEAEAAGDVKPSSVAALPQYEEQLLQKLAYVPPAAELWQVPFRSLHDVVVARGKSYYELKYLAAEHSWFFLLSDMLVAEDAPLPHTVYEDCMQVLTYSSLQRRPEKHFSIPVSLQRAILCRAAHFLTLDPDYFGTIEELFLLMEQQQSLGSEAYSAWVVCCIAANKPLRALEYLQHMEHHRVTFDPVVFSVVMHPHSKAAAAIRKILPHRAGNDASMEDPFGDNKGYLLQQRLCTALQASSGTTAVGLHAAFVFYCLTRRSVEKWELIRLALALGVVPSDRTRHLCYNILQKEKGRRCGPLTIKALCSLFAASGEHHRVLSTLLRGRETEKAFQLAPVEYSQEEAEELESVLIAVSPRQTKTHLKLLHALMRPENTNSPVSLPSHLRQDEGNELKVEISMDHPNKSPPAARNASGIAQDKAVKFPHYSEEVKAVLEEEEKVSNEVVSEVVPASSSHIVSKTKADSIAVPSSNKLIENSASSNDQSQTLSRDWIPLRKEKDTKRPSLQRTPQGHVTVFPTAPQQKIAEILDDATTGKYDRAAAFSAAIDSRRRAREDLEAMRRATKTSWINPEAIPKN